MKFSLLIWLLRNWPEMESLSACSYELQLVFESGEIPEVSLEERGERWGGKRRKKQVEWKSLFKLSVLSLSSVDCFDPTCSGHGSCVSGQCHCKPGWSGPLCDVSRAQCPDQCNGHGAYSPDTGLCSCDPNWMGPDCSTGVFPSAIFTFSLTVFSSCAAIYCNLSFSSIYTLGGIH